MITGFVFQLYGNDLFYQPHSLMPLPLPDGLFQESAPVVAN
jgi:hypothetical protein